MFLVVGIENPKKLEYETLQKTIALNLIYPLDNVCVLCRKPTKINMQQSKLHCGTGPAIEYKGWARYALNGVIVPEWIVMQKDTEIDPVRIKEIKNADVRREFVKKVGLERIRAKLCDKVLDEKTIFLNTPLQQKWPCKYSVLRLDFGDRKRHVLEMENPSLPGFWHVEYVPDDCVTVEQAMNFRLNRTEKDIDDKKGFDWYLHGDVVIKPKGAKKFKRWPIMVA